MAQLPELNPTLVAMAMARLGMTKLADGTTLPPPPPGGDASGGMAGGGGMDPSMMGGTAGAAGPSPTAPAPAPAPAPAAAAPAAPAGGGAPAAPPKMKAEDMIRGLEARMYNMQMQMTLMLNHMKVEIPPGVLVTPPGSFSTPQAEQAVPGGQQDPAQLQAQQPQSAISPIDPIQAAIPATGGGGGGGSTKQSAWAPPPDRIGSSQRPYDDVDVPMFVPRPQTPQSQGAALAYLLRSRQRGG